MQLVRLRDADQENCERLAEVAMDCQLAQSREDLYLVAAHSYFRIPRVQGNIFPDTGLTIPCFVRPLTLVPGARTPVDSAW